MCFIGLVGAPCLGDSGGPSAPLKTTGACFEVYWGPLQPLGRWAFRESGSFPARSVGGLPEIRGPLSEVFGGP